MEHMKASRFTNWAICKALYSLDYFPLLIEKIINNKCFSVLLKNKVLLLALLSQNSTTTCFK